MWLGVCLHVHIGHLDYRARLALTAHQIPISLNEVLFLIQNHIIKIALSGVLESFPVGPLVLLSVEVVSFMDTSSKLELIYSTFICIFVAIKILNVILLFSSVKKLLKIMLASHARCPSDSGSVITSTNS
jgi:hypothetical protein